MKLSEKACNQDEKFVVALDGPSASGKGAIGSALAQEFGLVYVQSSIVYRGLAYICLQKGISSGNTHAIIKLSETEDVISEVRSVDLNFEKIGEFASEISVLPEVRRNLGEYLTHLIKTTPRIVMEGRDIGTIVAPNADLKIFITANVEIRAERRFKQLILEGKECTLGAVLASLRGRDARDSSRSVAPLEAASDALVVDTSSLSPEEVVSKIKDFVACRV
ncbi:MAG: cytidylate kinase [Rickettsiales bacterium]|nr:MAG: cytidylate kinase [Rickettsiales bacterium]